MPSGASSSRLGTALLGTEDFMHPGLKADPCV